MGADDLIDFEVIENQKENIQSLPSGRSAKALAQLFTPPLSSGAGKTPSPSQTQDLNNAVRQEYEKELQAIDESDDPLDVYDRYVKWTLDAYPSAQNTPQSQLCPLLERATKAFQGSAHYRNDPRYLKLWLHYIRLFSDAPREAFAYLARHNIGDKLALFYEEFAAWLETAGRWTQAEEVYNLGVEKEARPTERLVRKYGEFQHRFESRPQDAPEPTSPALPTVRPALAAKIDPFSHASPAPADPQAQSRARTGTSTSKSGKPKLAIFSGGDEAPKPGSSGSMKGWDSIGSLADRKKENTTEARPWAGETLKVGKKNTGAQKMMIFKDETESDSHNESKPHPLREVQQHVNPKTGRLEVMFADLRLLYPNYGEPTAEEYCFEELMARQRGLLDRDFSTPRRASPEPVTEAASQSPIEIPTVDEPLALALKDTLEIAHKPQTVPLKGSIEDDLMLNDENTPPSQVEIEKAKAAKKARREERANRTRKIKVMEVREIKGETQTIHTNLDSPTGPKIRRKKKGGPEATMTINTKEAMDEVYEIFNQPLKTPEEDHVESESGEDSSDDDDDYTSAGESTGTGRISGATSEFGDETTAADFTLRTTVESEAEETEADTTDVRSVSAWSEFTESKHVPKEHRQHGSDDEESESEEDSFEEISRPEEEVEEDGRDLVTPISPEPQEGSLPTRFVPIPPEDYNAPVRPYRDPALAANNRLPFMTPIVEKTESSLGIATIRSQKEYFSAKTPSRSKGTPAILEDDGEPCSSPFQDVLDGIVNLPPKIAQLSLVDKPRAKEPLEAPKPQPLSKKVIDTKPKGPQGPIIKDSQCNPCDEAIRDIILSQIQPPLDSYDGYLADTESTCGKGAEIRKFTKALAKMNKNANDKTATNLSMPPVLNLAGTERTYTVKRELGKGAFAPVYLVESGSAEDEHDEGKPAQMGKGEFGLKRRNLEAMKMEDPPSPWEFYIMRQAKRRLGVSRAAESVVHAYEMHMFKDECYLIEEYRDQGTLLDLVNLARADNGVMDEQLAMFFTVELFRTVESLHAKGLIHGDLKSDNVLIRFDGLQQEEHWDSQYKADGRDGWAAKGIALIDFGRGIDMKVFKPDVQFIADWKTSEQDCAEMRELRPWTFQIDYHGLAGIVHNLLFGKYISTVAERGGTLGAGATKTYRIREALKRYWQTELWQEVFDLLLNPLMHLESEEGRKLPVLKGMKEIREKMEGYLEGNCDKGVGLKSLVRKMEEAVKRR
ncbi:Mad3/BUB1 homology region 1-domain-containing protein [Lophiotrema nucula]|uniref:Mad3/BUB1 homology region 1-domain-containing protein n=1 Tax=Lophiotrema nucula TaxID=690887 RepID=A0A6A5YHW0_9PLEO|nr:Mad3/BUB1 homology region 1-domain-containing protein [Lophiotrema nucula]